MGWRELESISPLYLKIYPQWTYSKGIRLRVSPVETSLCRHVIQLSLPLHALPFFIVLAGTLGFVYGQLVSLPRRILPTVQVVSSRLTPPPDRSDGETQTRRFSLRALSTHFITWLEPSSRVVLTHTLSRVLLFLNTAVYMRRMYLKWRAWSHYFYSDWDTSGTLKTDAKFSTVVPPGLIPLYVITLFRAIISEKLRIGVSNIPLVRGYPSNKAKFSISRGWP